MIGFRKLITLALKMRRDACRTAIFENGLRYAITAGLAVTVTATGWQLLQVIELIHGTPTVQAGTSAPAAPPSAAAPPDAAAAIASQHWFGQADSEGAAPPKAQVKTGGPVKVHGIIFARDKATTRAILVLNGHEKSYRVGEVLQNGNKVAAIRPDRVILTQSGARYALVLNHPKSAMLAEAPRFDGGTAVTDPGSAVAVNRPPPYTPVRSAPPAAVRGASTLQRLQSLRARLLSGQ